jgi:hypothetical protein
MAHRPPVKKRRIVGLQTSSSEPPPHFERDELPDGDSDWKSEEEAADEYSGTESDEKHDIDNDDAVTGSGEAAAKNAADGLFVSDHGMGKDGQTQKDILAKDGHAVQGKETAGVTTADSQGALLGRAEGEGNGVGCKFPTTLQKPPLFEHDELHTASEEEDQAGAYGPDDDGAEDEGEEDYDDNADDDEDDEDDDDDDDEEGEDDDDEPDAGSGRGAAVASTVALGALGAEDAGRSGLRRDNPRGRIDAIEDGGEEYQTFLRAILADDAPPTTDFPYAYSSLLDDDVDDDFDYMTAAAQQKEDPLEFRNDKNVRVSRKEIVSLVAGVPARRLRRQRASANAVSAHTSHASRMLPPLQQNYGWVGFTSPGIVPGAAAPQMPPLVVPTALQQFGGGIQPSGSPAAAPPAGFAAPGILGIAPTGIGVGVEVPSQDVAGNVFVNGLQPHGTPLSGLVPTVSHITNLVPGFSPHFAHPVFPPVAGELSLAPRPRPQLSEGEFWGEHANLLQRQLNSHVLLLSSVHAKASNAAEKESTAQMLCDLLRFRDTSRSYKGLFEPMRHNFEDPLYSGVGQRPVPDTYFATPALDAVDAFLRDAAAPAGDVTALLARFQPFAEQDVSAALFRSVSCFTSQDVAMASGEIPWTVEDDALLARTIAKHTMDFGEYSLNLLPHRSVDACEKRMRYLASRRCRDNPVKTQVLAMTSNVPPLSEMEIGIIRETLARIDPSRSPDDLDTDPPGKEVWQRVQRDTMPHRDWRQLEKIWTWRLARRRFKRNAKRKQKDLRSRGETGGK